MSGRTGYGFDFQAYAERLADQNPQVMKLRCDPPQLDGDAEPRYPADLWAADAWDIGRGIPLSVSPEDSARLAAMDRAELGRLLAARVVHYITYVQAADAEKAFACEIVRILGGETP
jgi:hypothetical protein